jgi:hypothetical protein
VPEGAEKEPAGGRQIPLFRHNTSMTWPCWSILKLFCGHCYIKRSAHLTWSTCSPRRIAAGLECPFLRFSKVSEVLALMQLAPTPTPTASTVDSPLPDRDDYRARHHSYPVVAGQTRSIASSAFLRR